MRKLSPFQLLTLSALIIVVISYSILTVLNATGVIIPFRYRIILPLILGIVSYLLMYFLIKAFIDRRLKVLYRTIRKGKINSENEFRFNIKEDVIRNAEKETQNWTENQEIQISKLQDQAKFKREFLGNLAHELKTPVFAIQGYLLTLIEGGLDDPKVNTLFLERAAKATDRMVNLLEDLDQITKLEGQHLPIQKKRFDIVYLVKEVFEALDEKAKTKNIKLKFDEHYDSIHVHADRAKIEQVFTNLISNSISYGNENGTTEVRFYDLDDTLTIEVSDNGPGIPAESANRVFERFYRIEKSRNRNEGGSGLGLSIVKHIVEGHNHSIYIRSTEGIGTTFIFTLDLIS